MGFLTPIYLAAIAAIAAPLIAHLIKQQPKANQVFGSLMFLSPSPPKVSRKSRIENWPLLLLRMAVIAIIALAFARPFLSASDIPSVATPRQLKIILLDRSGSMSRGNLWSQAIGKARTAIDNLEQGDVASLSLFDNQSQALFELATDQPQTSTGDADALTAKSMVADQLNQLEKLEPTQNATDYIAALSSALRQFDAYRNSNSWSPGTESQVVLISDFTGEINLSQLQTLQWPKELTFSLQRISSDQQDNASIKILGSAELAPAAVDERGLEQDNRLRVSIRNDAASSNDIFELQWNDENEKLQQAVTGQFQIPAGQARVLQIDAPKFERSILTLSGDTELLGNQCFYYERKQPPQQLAIVADSSKPFTKEQIGFYIEKIANPDFDQLPQVKVIDAGNLGPQLQSENRPDVLILSSELFSNNSKTSIAATGDVLNAYIDHGGVVLFVIDQLPQLPSIKTWWKAAFNDNLTSVEPLEIKDFLLWQNIDFRSQTFSSFDDAKSNNFARIHFWKAVELQFDAPENWQALASYDSGSPAMLHRSIGTGDAYVLTAGWQTENSQLALSTKFVPLILNLLPLRASSTSILSGTVGESISFAQPEFTPTLPGFYNFKSEEQTATIAVNIASEECNFDAIDLEPFNQLGISTPEPKSAGEREADAKQLRVAELESSQQWWRWLLVAGMAVVGLESLLSINRSQRR